MCKHSPTSYTRLLLAALLSAVLLCASPAVLAENKVRDFSDRMLAQVTKRPPQSQSQNRLPDRTQIERSQTERAPIEKRQDQAETRDEIRVSLDQAVSQVRRSSGGKVIKASTRWKNGKPVHNIRVLTEDNRVRTYRIDGVSGREL